MMSLPAAKLRQCLKVISSKAQITAEQELRTKSAEQELRCTTGGLRKQMKVLVLMVYLGSLKAALLRG